MHGTPPPAAAPVGTAVRVTVPGSSGNVGPGFDSLGLALGHYDTLQVTRIERGLEFELSGEGAADVPRTAEHLVVRAMQAAYDAAGAGSLPPVRITARNTIPHGRGMGSSASAVVAGVLAGNALLPEERRLGADDVLQVCSRLEGHPDNVAPTLLGGLTVSWEDGGRFHTVPVRVHPDVVPVVAVPDFEVATSVARGLLPGTVAHHDAAVNAGRAALVVAALGQRPDLLLDATFDLLHQPYRAQAMAPSWELVTRLRERGHAALISGAGPTVLTLANGAERARAAQEAIREITGGAASSAGVHGGAPVAWRVQVLRVPAEGAKVETSTQ
ncbi:homoserine kinase [Kocuria tytonicola]|uniref:Homoserine kinase n=1 Tax=Kocuria tytonicola TaxID=2055946 RepID=A0A3L9L8Y7_9MICC|nr:homoserine kinase [Kocuria tytonicola]RLY94654.1 homoserine kinase [Kocuria tytonicola]RLZ03556.1 homoserine kinase [Kocuria tytonicola]